MICRSNLINVNSRREFSTQNAISLCIMYNGAQYCPDKFLEGGVWATSHGMMPALHRNGRQEEAVANSSDCQFHEWPSWGIHTAVHLSLRWNIGFQYQLLSAIGYWSLIYNLL